MKRNFESQLFMRILCMMLAIMLVVHVLPFSVSAAGKSYNIKELGIQCTIPDSFTHVFTRDSIKSDADVAFLGMTKAEVLALFSESNIFLEAGTEYFETDLRITMAPNTVGNFSDFGDTLLSGMGDRLVDELKRLGYSNISSEIYHHTDTEFIMMQYSLPASDAYSYSIQYYTVMNLQAINFTCSFQSKPTASEKAMVKGIVDSAVFMNAPQKASEKELKAKYPAFDYSDDYVTFHLPDGWHQEEPDPNHTHVDAKFQRGNDSEAIITYGFQDAWSQLSATEKQGTTREDFSFSAMTDNEIIEIVSSDYEKIGAVVQNASTQIINGKKWGRVIFTIQNDTFGIPLEITTTQVAFLQNGYILFLSISQNTSGSYYDEFKSVLESVRFKFLGDSKTSTPSQAAATTPAASESSVPKTESNAIFYILGGAALLAIVVIAIVLRKKKKSTKIQIIQKEYISEATETRYTATGETAGQILFCHKCGSRLEPGSTVCKNCGTVIPR